MISNLHPKIKGLILDMDGVLWKGDQSINNLPYVFDQIRMRGLQFMLATNNAVRSQNQHMEKLNGFGLDIESSKVITSGMAVAELLAERFPSGGSVYIIGEAGILEPLAEKKFFPAQENVIAVVAGYDRLINFDKLKRATMMIRNGIPFYFTNPDRTFPTPEGLIPGAGAFLAFLTAATDVEPIIAGKPYPGLFTMAIQRMNLLPQEVLAVGDRLDTDILGGQRSGCRTAIVLSGVSTLEEALNWLPAPDLIAPDLLSILN
jgi:4-nitrophenyl phosphatase